MDNSEEEVKKEAGSSIFSKAETDDMAASEAEQTEMISTSEKQAAMTMLEGMASPSLTAPAFP